MTCNHEIKITEKIFSNGTKHLERRCIKCGRHLGYQAQNNDLKHEDLIYFKKHKGKTLIDVAREDVGYLEWIAENCGSYGLKVLKYLENNIYNGGLNGRS